MGAVERGDIPSSIENLVLACWGVCHSYNVALRLPPAADKGSKSAARNKEYGETALRLRRTTIFRAGQAGAFS